MIVVHHRLAMSTSRRGNQVHAKHSMDPIALWSGLGIQEIRSHSNDAVHTWMIARRPAQGGPATILKDQAVLVSHISRLLDHETSCPLARLLVQYAGAMESNSTYGQLQQQEALLVISFQQLSIVGVLFSSLSALFGMFDLPSIITVVLMTFILGAYFVSFCFAILGTFRYKSLAHRRLRKITIAMYVPLDSVKKDIHIDQRVLDFFC